MPSSTFTFVHQHVENLSKGVHNFTSDATCTPTFALCAAANAPTTASAVKGDLTEVAYTNLSTRVVTGVTAEQVSGTAPFHSYRSCTNGIGRKRCGVSLPCPVR
jgi:hypothetical protein